MNNRIVRIFDKNNVIVYKRYGDAKNFTPLARYFVASTGQEFKTITQVKKFIKSLN